MKKILSVVGARPNFMKVAPIDKAFKAEAYKGRIEHSIVHTGQHYDHKMSGAFFQDLDMPEPRFFLGTGSGSHAQQTSSVILGIEKTLLDYKPDMLIVVGDVNSTIAAALTAVKMGVPTVHVESGLRSGDREMPEEINRIATDAICDYCFVTEQSGLDHLKRENKDMSRVFFVGNTMIDSVFYALPKTKERKIWEDHGLERGSYILSTVHRPSNVDSAEGLELVFDVFEKIDSIGKKVLLPLHPRTEKRIKELGLETRFKGIRNLVTTGPLGYIDFQSAMLGSDFVLTDSGGIQEETTALGVDCITMRTTTERPSTIELGTNTLVPPNREDLFDTIYQYHKGNRKEKGVPPLWDGKAAERIAEIIDSLLNGE